MKTNKTYRFEEQTISNINQLKKMTNQPSNTRAIEYAIKIALITIKSIKESEIDINQLKIMLELS